jgi:hypothetical protein
MYMTVLSLRKGLRSPESPFRAFMDTKYLSIVIGHDNLGGGSAAFLQSSPSLTNPASQRRLLPRLPALFPRETWPSNFPSVIFQQQCDIQFPRQGKAQTGLEHGQSVAESDNLYHLHPSSGQVNERSGNTGTPTRLGLLRSRDRKRIRRTQCLRTVASHGRGPEVGADVAGAPFFQGVPPLSLQARDFTSPGGISREVER